MSTKGSNINTNGMVKLRNFNFWSINGLNDGTIPHHTTIPLFDYMNANNGMMKFTGIYGLGHGSGGLIIGSYAATKKNYSKADIETAFLNEPTEETTSGSIFNATESKLSVNPYLTLISPNADPEPNTLTWLFSKRRLPYYIEYNTWSNVTRNNLGTVAKGPFGDDDGDGHNNYFEFIADLNPKDAASRFTTLCEGTSPTTMAIKCGPINNARTYLVQRTDSLTSGAWTTLATIKGLTSTATVDKNNTTITTTLPTDRAITVIDALVGPRQFYRVQLDLTK